MKIEQKQIGLSEKTNNKKFARFNSYNMRQTGKKLVESSITFLHLNILLKK